MARYVSDQATGWFALRHAEPDQSEGRAAVSGVFSEWQPKYASHGIATFPVGEAKKPSIRSWQKIGLKGSAELAEKFIDADALGYVTGRRSNITVLDIDTTDEKIAEDAIRQHGQPVIVHEHRL